MVTERLSLLPSGAQPGAVPFVVSSPGNPFEPVIRPCVASFAGKPVSVPPLLVHGEAERRLEPLGDVHRQGSRRRDVGPRQLQGAEVSVAGTLGTLQDG